MGGGEDVVGLGEVFGVGGFVFVLVEGGVEGGGGVFGNCDCDDVGEGGEFEGLVVVVELGEDGV